MIDEDIRNFLTALLLVVGGLLPIVNPVGSAPMFLAMTRGADLPTRQLLAVKIAFNTFILIMGSLIFGAYVLKVFGLSVAVVQVAGGAVLCALGWNLLESDQPAPSADDVVDTSTVFMRAFYPLTLPLTVDPGAMAVAITLGAVLYPTLYLVAWSAHASTARGSLAVMVPVSMLTGLVTWQTWRLTR